MKMLRALALVLVGFSLVAVVAPAHASRVTPSTRIQSPAMGSGAQTASADIPATATNGLIGICYFNDVGPESTVRPTNVTLDGQPASFVKGAGNTSSEWVALYTVSGFSTGSGKVLGYTLSATGNYFGLSIGVEYRTDTPTYGASDAVSTAGGGVTATTAALANMSGDEIVSIYCSKDNFGVPPTMGSGQSKLDEVDDTTSQDYFGFTTETANGTSDAQTVGAGGTSNLPAIASLVITFSSATGAYDTNPSVTSQSDTAYTVTGSLDATGGTVDAVACYRNDTAPSKAEVQAHTCAGGATAAASDTDSPTVAPYDFSLTLTPGTRLPVFDIYVTDGTTLTTLADEFLDAPTGYGQVVIATNTPADPCSSYNSLYSPDIGIDTVIEFPLAPTSGNSIVGDLTVDNTCAADFDPDGDLTRRGFEDWNIYVSGSAFNSDDIDLWIYDPSIVLTVSQSPAPEVVLLTDTAVGSDPNPDIVIWQSDPDLARLCYHPLADAVTVSLTAGTLATGLSLSMGAITGTVAGANEDEDGELLTLRCTSDVTGGYQEFPLRITPATSWTVTPDCTSPALVKLECAQDIATLTHNSTTTDYTYETSDTVTAGRVISMSPAAGAEIAPYGSETLDISLGLSGNGTVSHIGIRIGVGL